MKIATFNVNSIRKRLDIVLGWLAQYKPDVLCLQETKVQDADFPIDGFARSGYHVSYRGMKSYNGVAVLSRTTPELVTSGLGKGSNGEDHARLLQVVVRGLPIINTYIPQGYSIDSPKYAYKLEWYRRLRAYFKRHFSTNRPVVWCGDMNVAPEPIDVHNPDKHLNHVCFHEDARQAYKKTVSWGFVDVYRYRYPKKQQYTFWDYRQPNALETNRGWRIDHILVTPVLARHCTKVSVDINPRRAENPSDHTVLWAEFSM